MQKLSLLAFSNFFLILVIPFCFFLHLHQYPVWRVEVGIFILILLLLALLFTAVWLWLAETARVCWLSLNMVISVSFLPLVSTSNILLIDGLGLGLLFFFIRRKILELLLIFLLTLCLGVILLPVSSQLNQPREQVWPMTMHNSELPPIIHIVLDEFIGISGIPESLKAMRQSLQTFYLAHGFRLYSNAYSHYVHTVDSIPNSLNFSTQKQSYPYLLGYKQPFILTQNHYFNYLRQKGYHIKVYQGNFIDYCQSKAIQLASCYTYPVTSIKLLQDQALPITQKLIFIAKSYLITSLLYRDLVAFYQNIKTELVKDYSFTLPDWPWGQARLNSLMLLPTMAKLKADLKSNPQAGNVYFAHILAPHSPYLYDANCHIIPDVAKWYLNIGLEPEINRSDLRLQRYAAYKQQVMCVQSQLQSMLQDLKKLGIYDKAIIVIQGDHGSRITQHDPTIKNKTRLTEQDWRDCFPALYAIKVPRIAAGIDKTALPLEILQAQALYWMTGVKLAIPIPQVYIYLLPLAGEKLMEKLNKV